MTEPATNDAETGIETGVENSADALQQRLNDPSTVASLTRLLDRIDSLEQTVDKLTDALNQAPGMISMMTDVADEKARIAAESGIDVDERLRSALVIAEKLTEPKTIAVLSGLLDRVDQLEDLVKMTDQAPGMIAMMTDVADEQYRLAAESGIDIEARVKTGLVLVEKLTTPQSMAVLSKLVDQMDTLEQAAGMLEQAPGMLAMGVDIADDMARSATESGLDIDQFTNQGFQALIKFSTLVASDGFDAVIDSGILDPDAVSIIGDMGYTLAQCRKDPPQRVGIFGLMRLLNDDDAKVALGFLANFARRFGARVCEDRRRELGMLP